MGVGTDSYTEEPTIILSRNLAMMPTKKAETRRRKKTGLLFIGGWARCGSSENGDGAKQI